MAFWLRNLDDSFHDGGNVSRRGRGVFHFQAGDVIEKQALGRAAGVRHQKREVIRLGRIAVVGTVAIHQRRVGVEDFAVVGAELERRRDVGSPEKVDSRHDAGLDEVRLRLRARTLILEADRIPDGEEVVFVVDSVVIGVALQRWSDGTGGDCDFDGGRREAERVQGGLILPVQILRFGFRGGGVAEADGNKPGGNGAALVSFADEDLRGARSAAGLAVDIELNAQNVGFHRGLRGVALVNKEQILDARGERQLDRGSCASADTVDGGNAAIVIGNHGGGVGCGLALLGVGAGESVGERSDGFANEAAIGHSDDETDTEADPHIFTLEEVLNEFHVMMFG